MMMKTIILIIGAISMINLVSGQFSERSCNNDQDCGGNNWVCLGNLCKCGVSYRQGNQRDCVTVFGSTCEAGDECLNLPGATCENNKCTCKAGLLLGGKECVKIGKENEECTFSADCIQRTAEPDDNKECKDKACVCKAGTHAGSDNRCRRSLGLHAACQDHNDCYQADTNNNNALECTEEGGEKQCKCKQNYKEEGDMCNGSATKFILSAFSLLIVVMAVLKM